MSDNKIEVGYWAIRGLAAPLRMMCHVAGAEWVSKTYAVGGEPGNWDLSAWFGVKPALVERNALMNLPYVVDGDVVVTQSNACLTHLGRKFGMNGSNETELVRMEQALAQVMVRYRFATAQRALLHARFLEGHGVLSSSLPRPGTQLVYSFMKSYVTTQDLRNDAVKLFYNPDYVNLKEAHYGSVPRHYKKLNDFMQQNGTTYVSSDSPSPADFHLWEMIDQHEAFAVSLGKDSLVAPYPKLVELYAKLKELPGMQAYLASDDAKLPINNVMAGFK